MADSKFDPSSVVKKKIEKDENCVLGASITDVKTTRYVALIERQLDHAIFIFSSKYSPNQSVVDLRLEKVFPLNEDFRIQIDPPSPLSESASLIGLQLKDEKFLMECGSEYMTFMSEVQRALHSQTTGFGPPSTFSWLDKYQKQNPDVAPVSVTPVETKNPLENEMFDRVKYMQLDDTGMQSQNREDTLVFEDVFSEKVCVNSDSSQMKKFSSKDSLDDILQLEDSNSFTHSIDKLTESKPGIKRGTEISERETFINFNLKNRQVEYVTNEIFRIFVGTWNVNGQGATDLAEWLACDKDPPDIYAIGFQELDLSNQAYIFSDSARESEWQDVVHKCLHPKARYQKVKSIRLVGVLLIVYIMEVHIGQVSLIDTDYVPTGIMGMLGNKGGVSVRLCLHDTTLCFINTHLAAHQDEYERRNQDSYDIESKIKFRQFLPPLTVKDHDMVFWLGDLNYRIDLDLEIVKDYITQKVWHKLLEHDQLYQQLNESKVYKTYIEGAISFPPTYKYDTGTDNFDTSEKCRIPAWCDRILYKGNGIRQIVYRSHPSLKISDHKPVSSLFDAGIKVVIQEKFKKVYEDIMKQLDRQDNDELPQVSLTNREFVFKDVKFLEPQTQILAVANIGQNSVRFEFIKKCNEDTFCKPWLKVDPSTAVIHPGYSCEILLEVLVDQNIAYQFNYGREHIDDILVLHLHKGKDLFIPISGNYIVSSFGSSIAALIQMHHPIREIPADRLIELERPGSLNNVDTLAEGTRLFGCPKEIYRLVHHIWEYGRHQEDLFRQPGLNLDIYLIRDSLDSIGQTQELPGGIHSVAEALILFLEALAEPVIPYRMYEDCLKWSSNYLPCKQLLSKMPNCHRNVFKYVCAFLRELLKGSQFNTLDVKYLSQMFGEVFLRPPPSRMPARSSKDKQQLEKLEEIKKCEFLYHFLIHNYDE